jgi:hypothetical protein
MRSRLILRIILSRLKIKSKYFKHIKRMMNVARNINQLKLLFTFIILSIKYKKKIKDLYDCKS